MALGADLSGPAVAHGRLRDQRVPVRRERPGDLRPVVQVHDLPLRVADRLAGADFAELAEFIKAVGFATLQCESGAAKKLNFTAETEGCVVRYVENKIPQKAVNLKNNFEEGEAVIGEEVKSVTKHHHELSPYEKEYGSLVETEEERKAKLNSHKEKAGRHL